MVIKDRLLFVPNLKKELVEETAVEDVTKEIVDETQIDWGQCIQLFLIAYRSPVHDLSLIHI